MLLGGAPGDLLNALESTCLEQGIEYHHCEDIAAVTEYAKNERADVACFAHYLQDVTGFEACRALRKVASWQDLPVVFFSEKPNTTLIEKAFAAGFNETFHLNEKDALFRFLQRRGEYTQPLSGSVLVVEDSPSQQRFVRSVLETVGLDVSCADNVVDALAIVDAQDIDLVITDVVLIGDLTGLDLIGRLHRIKGHKGDIPVMVMSTYGSAAQRIEPFRLGASDYISKPIAGDELLVRARRLIESRHLMNRVREQSQALVRANKMMSQMLGRVSHECRNSINIVLGISRIILRKKHMEEGHEGKVETIVSASEHQLSLLNDILDYTKLDSGNIEVHETLVEIEPLVGELTNLLSYKCDEVGLALTAQIAETVPGACVFDARLIKQILINLLTNAVKFTQKGSIELVVDVRADTDAEQSLILGVRDTGPGISKTEQESLFEAFKQTETGLASGEGTGLGLSLCAGFASVMGGEMSVVSEEGEGSYFFLSLPLKEHCKF